MGLIETVFSNSTAASFLQLLLLLELCGTVQQLHLSYYLFPIGPTCYQWDQEYFQQEITFEDDRTHADYMILVKL